jgi:hypothetical protein
MAMLLFATSMRQKTGLFGDQIAWQNLDSGIPNPATISEICGGGSLWELRSKSLVKDVHSSQWSNPFVPITRKKEY